MTKFSATLAAALLMAASPGQAADAQPQVHADEGDLAEKIVGTWELVSYQVEDKATGSLIDAMGSAPRGRVIFTPDGWVAFNLEGTDRKPAETDADRAALMKTLVAYIGRYRIEGDQWITTVQTAWAPEWVNTEQRRTIKIHGDEADVTTPWRIMPNWDGRPPLAQHHPVPAQPIKAASAMTRMHAPHVPDRTGGGVCPTPQIVLSDLIL